MTGARAHSFPHLLLDCFSAFAFVEKSDVLLPAEPNHDPQPMLGGDIEQPPRRNRVRSYGVSAEFRDFGEVGRNSFSVVIETAVDGW